MACSLCITIKETLFLTIFNFARSASSKTPRKQRIFCPCLRTSAPSIFLSASSLSTTSQNTRREYFGLARFLSSPTSHSNAKTRSRRVMNAGGIFVLTLTELNRDCRVSQNSKINKMKYIFT